MITRVSALLSRKTRKQILSCPARALAITRVREAGLPIPDVAGALNCSQLIIQMYLLPKIPGRLRAEGFPAETRISHWDTRWMSRNERGRVLYRPPRTPGGVACERETLASHLSLEIRRFVHSISVGGADPRGIVKWAGRWLDRLPVNREREFMFDVDRAVFELKHLWMPEEFDMNYRDSNSLFGRWLASWISFWVPERAIWSRALDLALGYFRSPNTE